jgi:pimeloyl-ACP methyl ester carboxylesterase
VTIADHTRDDSMGAIARRILESAPGRFALVGLSMGGYVAFEVMRQAGGRVVKLALLDTTARPDAPEATEVRRQQIAMVNAGQFGAIADLLYPRLVHPKRADDDALRNVNRLMAKETGPEAFVRQQQAIITRVDSRPTLASIGCPTLMLVGDSDQITPPDRAEEIANGIAGARLVKVANCGHLSTLEAPDDVSAALENWLEA